MPAGVNLIRAARVKQQSPARPERVFVLSARYHLQCSTLARYFHLWRGKMHDVGGPGGPLLPLFFLLGAAVSFPIHLAPLWWTQSAHARSLAPVGRNIKRPPNRLIELSRWGRRQLFALCGPEAFSHLRYAPRGAKKKHLWGDGFKNSRGTCQSQYGTGRNPEMFGILFLSGFFLWSFLLRVGAAPERQSFFIAWWRLSRFGKL